jgi:hypothetical protein
MTRLIRLARRIRPAAEDFAAAAALHDPNPLLQLQAARRCPAR